MKNILLFLFLYALFIQFTFAWCYPRENFISIVSTKPHTTCINADIYSSCIWNFTLHINSTCENKYFIFNELGEKLKLNSSNNWLQEDPYILDTQKYDHSILQDFWKWERKLVNIENPNDIIYLKWKIKSKSPVKNFILLKNDINYQKLWYILWIIVFIFFWWRLFLKFSKKWFTYKYNLMIEMEKWIKSIVQNSNIPKEINAINFWIFEDKNWYNLYIIGSKTYDKANDDWACNQDYIPQNNTFTVKNRTINN